MSLPEHTLTLPATSVGAGGACPTVTVALVRALVLPHCDIVLEAGSDTLKNQEHGTAILFVKKMLLRRN